MFYKLQLILKAFSKKERLAFLAALLVFAVSLVSLSIIFINGRTKLVPIAGGRHIEGVVGQPVFINPVLSAMSEPDGDLIQLVFAGVSDLLDTNEIENDGKIWKVRIKGDLFWQDGAPLTADDLIFTIKAIQDPALNSPHFSAWKGARVERISVREIKITLPSKYVYFENTLRNLRPIPKHIFENTAFPNMKLAKFNLEPVASGPFKFSKIKKEDSGFISQYELVPNEKYFGQKPYLEGFEFRFYPNDNDLIEAFNSGEVDALSGIDPQRISEVKAPRNTFRFSMPRYFAVFINSASRPVLKSKDFRRALNLATDKNKIIETAFAGFAVLANGPLTEEMEGYWENNEAGYFDRQKAAEELAALGWENNNGALEKDGEKLSLTLTVPDIAFLKKTAEEIKNEWGQIGLALEIKTVSPENFYEEVLADRNYELLLFGNVYGANPDLFSFWHSSEKFHPGLNLSLFDNSTVDKLIEETRTMTSPAGRINNLARAQATIEDEQPAIFLASSEFIYLAEKSLTGPAGDFIPLPSARFKNISDWYVKTARVFK